MKRFLGSMANRIFLILIAGILIATGMTTWLANYSRSHALQEAREQHHAERIEQIILVVESIAPEARIEALKVAKHFGMEISEVSTFPQDSISDENTPFVSTLRELLGNERKVVLIKDAQCMAAHPDGPASRACNVIYVTLKDRTQLRLQIRPPGRPMAPPPPRITLHEAVFHGLFLVLIAILAYAVSRMAARPIRQLAKAATSLGNNLDNPPLPETRGPMEIRQAAGAFNAMQARIRRQIQHRTHMLAAVTHDLQTPMTRLRLRLEKVQDEELRGKLITDLSGMQGLVREGLDLARSMDSTEALQRLDTDSLMDSVCADAIDGGQDVTLTGTTGAFIQGQPNALRRCLTNLVDNAVKYGQHARVAISRQGQHVVIRLCDNGPGIPEDQLEAVFDPFYRLENSRSRDTGGTGLGLTIARNIAQTHRGTLTLSNLPEGGLVATLTLPIA